MAKKVRCEECSESMNWAILHHVDEENYEYAKYVLNVVRNTFVCGETRKVKRFGHEQYCKKFSPKDERRKMRDEAHRKSIDKLQDEIKRFEKTLKRRGK